MNTHVAPESDLPITVAAIYPITSTGLRISVNLVKTKKAAESDSLRRKNRGDNSHRDTLSSPERREPSQRQSAPRLALQPRMALSAAPTSRPSCRPSEEGSGDSNNKHSATCPCAASGLSEQRRVSHRSPNATSGPTKKVGRSLASGTASPAAWLLRK